MGDMGDTFRAMKETNQAVRNKHGVPCPKCQELLPKAHPKILLPGQTCNKRGHKYRDPRERLTDEERYPGWTVTRGKNYKVLEQPDD